MEKAGKHMEERREAQGVRLRAWGKKERIGRNGEAGKQ